MKRPLERGSAMVEFALAAPLLVLLFLGVWQFGYAFYQYNELEQAVRAGARYASMATYDGQFQANVKNMVVYGTPAPAVNAVPVVSRLRTSNVTVTPTPASGHPETIRVSIHDFPIGTFWSVVLPDKPSVQFPFVGAYSGS
jgi:Flp pilus assembly protein TadG